jgi:hypothetical protein
LDSFHQTSWNFVGISTIVCGSFWRVEQIQRSTTSWCCSCLVSSISVWRVTCYNHFCVFQIFSILAVSMATAAFWKNQPLIAQLHMAYDIPIRFHKVWSRNLCGR